MRRGGAEEVARRSLEEIGQAVSEEAAKRHLDAHRPLQAPAEKTLPRAQALRLVEKLTVRQRAIVELVYRVRALSAEQLGLLFHLQGNKAAALTAANRDLRKLVRSDLVYRVYLEHLPGAGPRPRQEVPALYYLARQARPHIKETTGRWPQKREEWVDVVGDLDEWQAPYELWLHSQVPSLLYPQLEAGDEAGVRVAEIGGWQVRFDAANWFDGRFVSFRIDDPMHQHRRLRADGLAAFGLISPKGRGALIPVLYYRDQQTRPADRYAERLHAHAAIPRTTELSAAFAGLPLGIHVPALVVCDSPARVAELAEATRRLLLPPQTPVLACDVTTAANHGLSASCWRPLFRRDPDTVQPVNLIEGLASGATHEARIAPDARLRPAS